jgi:hypothetical protein
MSEEPTYEDRTSIPASPFSPTPRGGVSGGGCSRFGLIGCGLLTLLLGIGAIVFLLKAGDLFAWAMARFEAEISEALPEDLSEAERQRLHEAFAQATQAVRSGEFDPLALQRLQGRLRDSLLDSGGELTRDQVLGLIDLLEAVARAEDRPVPEEVIPTAVGGGVTA